MSDSGAAPRRPTITDVADAAHVSRAAVSKVLRGAYGVSDDMRERVNAAIEALDYRPLLSARGLRSSTRTLGIVLPNYANPFFAEVVEGAMDRLQATDYQLIMIPSHDGAESAYRAVESLYDRQVDGILVISSVADPAWLDRMGSRVPLVALGRHDRPTNYDVVAGDDLRGTRQLMTHLLELGHERIMHVRASIPDGPARKFNTSTLRETAYGRAMVEAGLDHRRQVLTSPHQEKAVFDTVVRALAGDVEPPTAIFASNDEIALGVLRATARLTTSEISVAGFDDSSIAAHPLIDLTTVNLGGPAMGSLAINMLLERVAGRREVRRELLPAQLVTRGSTRAVAARGA